MDPFLARNMIESLSKGVDPVTGRPLSQNDSCSNEEVRQALQEVLTHCTIDLAQQESLLTREDRRKGNAQRYPRGGESWTATEEQEVLNLLRRGKNVYQIAASIKRTPRAIAERLKVMQRRQGDA